MTARTIYFDALSENARRALAPLAFDTVDAAADAQILWLRKRYRRFYSRLRADQLLNHLPGEGLMTRKADLAWVLHHRARQEPNDPVSPDEFYKETYLLAHPGERREFLERLPEVDTPENLWILKPSTLSKGEGVRALWDLTELREQLRDESKMTLPFEGKEYEYVIQRYIRDVLLLENRKSEIRVYWMIASLDPLRVLVFPEGLVRLSSQEFDINDVDNRTAHVINVFQQKKDPNYDPDQELKWTFGELEAYCHQQGWADRPDWIESQLLPKIERALGYVVRSIYTHVRGAQPKKGNFFGLYGADFLLDQQLTPWLAEVQRGPGLAFDDRVKRELIPEMLQEAMAIALEIFDRREDAEEFALESVRRFRWIASPVEAERGGP